MNSAIVTGASRGIGAATARELARQGYAVCVHYRENREEAQHVVDFIMKAGGKAASFKADMGVEDDIKRLFEFSEKELGPLQLLVNNAAVNPKTGSGALEEMPWEQMEETFRVNVVGTMTACREAILRMNKNGGGAIVNVSSEAGKFGGNRMAHYASSKAAVNMLTVALAREVAGHHIRVNAVSPGVIDTHVHAGASAERMAHLNSTMPMGRMGSSEEVARTIAWLLSDDASYVSGSILTVAGAR